MPSTKQLRALQIDNIFPFYIDNVNDKFFSGLAGITNKRLSAKLLNKIQAGLPPDERAKFFELQSLARRDKILLMLNLCLKKIVSKTGSVDCDLFVSQGKDRFDEALYVYEVPADKDVEIVNDDQTERRHNLAVDINPHSYLSEYAKKIRLSFYLDEENKLLSGGFGIQLIADGDQPTDVVSLARATEAIYIGSLIRHYVLKQLYPIKLQNFLDIISEYTKAKQSKNKLLTKPVVAKQRLGLNFKGMTTDSLREGWNDWLTRKYLNYKSDWSASKKQAFADNLFFSMLIATMIMLALYEELKIYFTSQKPELLVRALDRPAALKEDPNQNPETDFFALGKFLQQNYYRPAPISQREIAKAKAIKDVVELVSTYEARTEYEAFGDPVPVYTLQTDDTSPFVSGVKVVCEDEASRTLFLLTAHPELFGMNEDTPYFIDYGQLNKVLSQAVSPEHLERTQQRARVAQCDLHNNYATFITRAPAIVIFQNETVQMFMPYFWAEIYAQARIWMRNDIEHDFNNPAIFKGPTFYREKIRALESLAFNYYDDFYGLSEIKTIVRKIDAISDFKNSIGLFVQQLKREDSMHKKDSERRTMVIAFVVAAIIGVINFFGMVYTILTVTNVDAGAEPLPNKIVLGITSCLALCLVIAVAGFAISMYRKHRK